MNEVFNIQKSEAVAAEVEVLEREHLNNHKATGESEGTAATEETKAGVYVHRFNSPKKYNNKEIETLTFDYNKLTGKAFIKIEQEMTDQGAVALDPLLSKNFQARLAAKAAGVGVDFIESLGVADFYKITSSARNFLVELA